MKSATIAAALLASVAVAQPHGHERHHHAKRDMVTEWETVWETATVIIDDDSTQTIAPSPQETSSGSPGQFFQPESSSSSSSSSFSSVAAPTSSEVESAAATPTTPTTIVSIAQPTYQTPSSPSSTSTPTPTPTTPTSTYVAPTQQTTEEPATPSSSSTYAAPAPSSSSASSGGSGSSDGIQYGTSFSGEITYYNPALGACGYTDGDDDTIVAIPKAFWDSISTLTSYGIDLPAHPLCNKKITIKSGDKTATATIHDRCDGCVGHAIDVTPKIFKDLFGSLDGGRLDCTWEISE